MIVSTNTSTTLLIIYLINICYLISSAQLLRVRFTANRQGSQRLPLHICGSGNRWHPQRHAGAVLVATGNTGPTRQLHGNCIATVDPKRRWTSISSLIKDSQPCEINGWVRHRWCGKVTKHWEYSNAKVSMFQIATIHQEHIVCKENKMIFRKNCSMNNWFKPLFDGQGGGFDPETNHNVLPQANSEWFSNSSMESRFSHLEDACVKFIQQWIFQNHAYSKGAGSNNHSVMAGSYKLVELARDASEADVVN